MNRQRPALELRLFLPFRLNRLAAEMSARLHKIYGARHGIDIPEWRVIATLGSREPATAQEIVRSTRTHKSTISRAVSKLLAMGWIERIKANGDRRHQPLRFTEAGRRAYGEIVPLVLAVERDVLVKLGPDKKHVLETIGRLEGALEISDPD